VANIAGGSVLSLREYLERRHGPGAFHSALDLLPEDQAGPLREIVLPVRWYSARAFVGTLHAAHALWGGNTFYEDYGAFAAEYEINAFQKFVLRFTSPMFFLERAGRMWRRFHDTGTWTVEGSAQRLRGTLRDFAIVDADYCRVLAAWLLRAGEMTGARGAVTHPECRARAGHVEVFSGWWR
jgi:hypothetical protein